MIFSLKLATRHLAPTTSPQGTLWLVPDTPVSTP